jgi:hypothetical protein
MKKALLVTYAILLLVSISSATAQIDSSIATPSPPEFTLKLVGSSIIVTIKNQPLTAFREADGSYPNLYYGFRFQDSTAIIGDYNYAPPYYVGKYSYGTYYKASNSDYTTVSLPLEGYHLNISPGEQINFQVIALVGHDFPNSYENGLVHGFEGVTSGWSKQTVIISDDLTFITSTPAITPTPSATISLPTATPSTLPTPIPTPIITPSNSPTQQPTPTLELIQTASPLGHGIQADNFAPMIIIIALVIVAVIVGLLAYLAKNRVLK